MSDSEPDTPTARIGYARVSTRDQDAALQRDALTAAGCAPIFEDQASGARTERPGLAEALGFVREDDVLVVWKLDRLGRSLSHLIETVADLEVRGVGFQSITEAIDTTTSGGRLTFHLFGALGQFERDLDDAKLRRAHALIAKGFTVREAAARLKIGKSTLYDAIRQDVAAVDRQPEIRRASPHRLRFRYTSAK